MARATAKAIFRAKKVEMHVT